MRLIWVWALGALGGTINAWLYYAGLPVPGDLSTSVWIVPAGTWHGGILALVSVGSALFLRNRRPILRWLAIPMVGWLAGWLSFISIDFYIDRVVFQYHVKATLLRSIGWIGEQSRMDFFWVPFAAFGLVGSIYYLLLCPLRLIHRKEFPIHFLAGVAGGFLGSLWWWIGQEQWFFSYLHGAVWGMLVAFGVWKFFSGVKPSPGVKGTVHLGTV